MKKLGALKELREAQGLSQRDLAQLSGIAQVTVGQLERLEREARPSTLRKLAQALGVEPAVLLVEPEQAAKTLGRPTPGGNRHPVRIRSYRYNADTGSYTYTYEVYNADTGSYTDTYEVSEERDKSWLEHFVENDDPSVAYAPVSPGQDLSEDLTIAQMQLDSDSPEDLAEAAQIAARATWKVTESMAGYLRSHIRNYETLPDYYYEDPATARRVGEAAKDTVAAYFRSVKILQKFLVIRDEALNRLAQQTEQNDELLSKLLYETSPDEGQSKLRQQEGKEGEL